MKKLYDRDLPIRPKCSPETIQGQSGWFRRDFALLWIAQAISQLGNRAFALAMSLWTLEATGSTAWMGTLMAASTLPAVLLAPLGGALADRWNRLRLLIVADLVSGLTLAALAWWVGVVAEPRQALPAVFGVAVVNGVMLALISPTVSSLAADLVPEGKLAAANAMTQGATQLSMLVGQGLGGVAMRWFGAPLLLALDALSFLLAAGCESAIRAPARPLPPSEPWRLLLPRLGAEMAEGGRFLRRQGALGRFVFAAASFNFFSMPVLVLLPHVVAHRLEKPVDWYGYLLAALGLGAILGFLVAGMLPSRHRRRVVLLGMIVCSLALGATGLVTEALSALGASMLLGFSSGVVNVLVVTELQLATPAELRGRVMGALSAATGIAAPAGLLLGGLVADWTGPNVPAIALVCAAASVVVSLGVLVRNSSSDPSI